MTHLTKFSAVALFSLFLTACDKPTEAPKTAEAPVQSATAEPAAISGIEEFKNLVAWGQKQQSEMLKLQSEFQQKLASQDASQIAEAAKTFETKFSAIQKELESMVTNNADVNTLRLKMHSSMTISGELISAAAKMAANPASAAELQPEIQKKTAVLQQLAADIQKTSTELTQKFGVAQ